MFKKILNIKEFFSASNNDFFKTQFYVKIGLFYLILFLISRKGV